VPAGVPCRCLLGLVGVLIPQGDRVNGPLGSVLGGSCDGFYHDLTLYDLACLGIRPIAQPIGRLGSAPQDADY